MKFAFVDVDGDLVDARLPTSHQPLIVKLPEFIAISPEPQATHVVVLVLEANRDTRTLTTEAPSKERWSNRTRPQPAVGTPDC